MFQRYSMIARRNLPRSRGWVQPVPIAERGAEFAQPFVGSRCATCFHAARCLVWESMSEDLPESIRAIYERLAGPVDGAGLSELRARIHKHNEKFRSAARSNGLLPVDIATALAQGLEQLLNRFHDFSEHQQALVAGAAKYFVSDCDAQPDLEGVLGLDDDLVVYNWVVTELGRPDLCIEL